MDAYVQQAQEAAGDAADYAAIAQEYSGNPPIIQDGTWWIWKADEQEYIDTEELAQGTSFYVHIKWSAVEPDDDNDMKDTPDAYIGIYTGLSEAAPTSYTAYQWYYSKGQVGPVGPANTLSIGTVQSGESANATITGEAPDQTLNLTLPKGDTGVGLQYHWDGTKLGIRREGESSYIYVDLKGQIGNTGAAGRGIASVVLFSGNHAPGTSDTYRITFTDATTFDFQVYNGADGEGTGDMLASVYADSPGVVKDAAKLGGQLPTYYAKASDIPDISGKVDKITGKGLSTEDYTSAEKTKLSGIAEYAEVNVNADWNATEGDAQILNKPATMAPSAHAASHKTGGGDALTPADIGAAAPGDIPSAYTSNPAMDGTASAGSSTAWAKGDHVHPSDTGKLDKTIEITSISANTTLAAAHNGQHLLCTNASAITITVPIDLGAGFNCTLERWGAGTVTIARGGTATLNGGSTSLTMSDQYKAAVSILAVQANVFSVKGGLA